MGNETSQIEDFPTEIYIYVLEYFWNDLNSLSCVSKSCHFLNDLCNDDNLWKTYCEKRRYFEMMQIRRKIMNEPWKNIYKIFLREIIKTCEILIGDRINPEDRVLIQLKGDGTCFISQGHIDTRNKVGSLLAMTIDLNNVIDNQLQSSNTELKEDYHVKYNDYLYIMGPANEKFLSTGLNKIRIVDFSSYDPVVLLLSDDNRVFEFILSPSWIPEYKEFAIPKEISLPLEKDDRVKLIKCLPIANFAVVNSNGGNKIFAWTCYEQEGTGKIVRTETKIIEQLSEFDIIDIVYVNSVHTEFAYLDRKKKIQKLTVENSQLFYLIMWFN